MSVASFSYKVRFYEEEMERNNIGISAVLILVVNTSDVRWIESEEIKKFFIIKKKLTWWEKNLT